MNYIYGIDPSLSSTGVTIYDLETKRFVYIGSIQTTKIKSQKKRYHNALKLKHVYDSLSELKAKYPPTVIAIERGFSRFNTSTQVTYRVHGLINLLFYDVEQVYYPPKAIKEAVLSGNATKQQVQQAIKVLHLIRFVSEDESDSFAVCLTYLIKKDLIDYEKPALSNSEVRA
ncbi:crossover junction endodeoxyribonuclease RuvC [Thermoactinomyces sp. DSM 45892]|uniref:crossover junction endodeoxyribonuclease RuvC n=1 Tax=Thermoactinomyces sp. DSM 45892 TaxID=1882753 RepID=UPI00159FE07C|nr:crossover junction endodeoxyribonuclease RuvC [Thermoactinomyces sp. DSM 45892]